MGDTSKGGYGSRLSIPKEKGEDKLKDPKKRGGVQVRHGVWCKERKYNSSNNQELRNSVEMVKEGVDAGRREGLELSLFTENVVSESVYYRGNSINQEPYEFMLRLVYL